MASSTTMESDSRRCSTSPTPGSSWCPPTPPTGSSSSTEPPIFDLGSDPSLDPGRAGAKAARLAAAFRTGIPILPGMVVSAPACRRHMAVGAETLTTRGSGGARLAVLEEPFPFAGEVVEAGRRLGIRLVARSSTALEGSGEWSGAFTSYLDLTAEELPKAVLGCWASAFSVAALERQSAASVAPGSVDMAVLIQPALQPEAGGVAAVDPSGRITVHGVEGSPAPLLQGWSAGLSAVRDRVWEGALIDLIGLQRLEELGAVLGATRERVGFDQVEWAVAGDRLWMLQVGWRAPHSGAARLRPVEADPLLAEVAVVVARAPGPLGEELVLPWALGGWRAEWEQASTPALPPDRLREAAGDLAAQVWGLPPGESLALARAVLAELRGPDPARVLERIGGLAPPDPEMAGAVLGGVRQLVAVAAESSRTGTPERLWHRSFDTILAMGRGERTMEPGRVGVGRWEPFLASAAFASGRHHHGVPASGGVGAGVVWRTRGGTGLHGAPPRRVVHGEQPIPNLAPLLWEASGLVTATGSPGAHLFESARALGVPAVCRVDLDDAADSIVAVDGHTGTVATLSLQGGER